MNIGADEPFLRRAIRLAMNGRGGVEPNPMVSCVLVKEGRVIGEGYHARFGGPHAEPTALASCTESPAGATAYVTLEPCCHTDKKTPPCAPRLIREKIARVVVGCLDPNPAVNGNGVRMLREAGVVVEGPVLEAECKQLIAPFLKRVNEGRPYITLKWAESADGKVAGPGGRRTQISNARSSRLVQVLRTRCNGVVVGIDTVLNDDPTLLPRDLPVPAFYERIVLDTRLRLPLNAQLVRTADRSPVIAVTTPRTALDEHALQLSHRDVTLMYAGDPDPSGHLSLDTWLQRLQQLGRPLHAHLLVEPGPTLAAAMLHRADRLWVIRSPDRIDAPTAPAAVTVPVHFVATGKLDLDGDCLTEYLNTRSSAFAAPVPSADFELAKSDLRAAN